MSLGVVLITGASQGIGLATSEHLAKAGYKVYATCRDPQKAQKLQELSSRVNNIVILQLDVTSQYSVDQAVKTIYEKEHKIDVVINNACFFGIFGPSEMHTIGEMEQIFNTNIFGVKRVNQAVIPIMRKLNKGRIIHLSSISGAIPSKNIPIYSASKAALQSLAASDAFHLAPWNIKVAVIQPGPVLTDFESRTEFGKYFDKKENPYSEMIQRERVNWKNIMDNGQSPLEVAKVIQKAIEDIEPQHWYQTSEKVSEDIGKHFIDITGNSRVPKIKAKSFSAEHIKEVSGKIENWSLKAMQITLASIFIFGFYTLYISKNLGEPYFASLPKITILNFSIPFTWNPFYNREKMLKAYASSPSMQVGNKFLMAVVTVYFLSSIIFFASTGIKYAASVRSSKRIA